MQLQTAMWLLMAFLRGLARNSSCTAELRPLSQRGPPVSRLWYLAAAALGAFALIRRRYARRSSPPKLDEVSTDWLAYARSRSDETL